MGALHISFLSATTTWMWLFIMIAFVGSTKADIIVHTKNGTSIQLAAIEIIYMSGTNEPIVEPITLEATHRFGNISGKIFVMKNGPENEKEILKLQRNNSKAVIVLSAVLNVPGLMRLRWNDKDAIAQIEIPLFETSKSSGIQLWNMLENDEIDSITLLPAFIDDGNPWDTVYPSVGYYIWTALLMAFNVTNIALAIWKIKLFADFYGGINVSMAFFVLFIEIISNLIRLVGLVDLFGVNLIYPEQVAFAFTEQSFPFVISSMMLFTLYWHEMMTTSSVIVHPFIVKMRIPFFVISSCLIALSIIRNFLRAYTVITSLNFVMSAIWACVNIALVIFYVITGAKVLKRLKENKKSGRKALNLKKSTIRILISIGFIFLFCCIALLFAVDLIYFPAGLLAGWYSLYTVMNGASIMNILAFVVPTSGSSGTSYRSSRTNRRSVQAHNQTSQESSVDATLSSVPDTTV